MAPSLHDDSAYYYPCVVPGLTRVCLPQIRPTPTPPAPTTEVTDLFLDPSSPEALAVKLSGLTQSLSHIAQRNVYRLPDSILRQLSNVRESYHDGVLTVTVLSGEKVLREAQWRLRPEHWAARGTENDFDDEEDDGDEVLAWREPSQAPRQSPPRARQHTQEELDHFFSSMEDPLARHSRHNVYLGQSAHRSFGVFDPLHQINLAAPSAAIYHSPALVHLPPPPAHRRTSPPTRPLTLNDRDDYASSPIDDDEIPPLIPAPAHLRRLGQGWAEEAQRMEQSRRVFDEAVSLLRVATEAPEARSQHAYGVEMMVEEEEVIEEEEEEEIVAVMQRRRQEPVRVEEEVGR